MVALRTCICERPSHLRSATHNQHPHNRSVKTWHIIASLFRTVGKRFFSITPVHLAGLRRSCELYGIWIPGHHFPKLRGGTFSAANFFANPRNDMPHPGGDFSQTRATGFHFTFTREFHIFFLALSVLSCTVHQGREPTRKIEENLLLAASSVGTEEKCPPSELAHCALWH